jgi:hypothetical protein
MARITGTLHEDLCKFMVIYRWILLRMRNILDNTLTKIKTYILCSISFSENFDVFERLS